MVEKPSCCPEFCVCLNELGFVISLSDVALVGCLGVRSLTEEEQLYIRLSRLGKYFSIEKEICTFFKVIRIEC
jgi:hypothetical protein